MPKKLVSGRFVDVLTVCVACLVMVGGSAAQTEKSSSEALAVRFEQFKAAQKLPCGQRLEAVLIGREIVGKYVNDELNREVVEYVKNRLDTIRTEEFKCSDELTIAKLYDKFKAANKLPCGQRGEAVRFGKLMLELYKDDTLNQDVLDFIKKRVETTEKEDPVCQRENVYIEAWKAKNWAQVFTTGKVIIDAEVDKAKALDIMLDLIQVGYDRMAYEDDDSYNVETVNHALKAIDLMEKGVKTNGCWGAYACFRDREKALGWLHYIVGYVSYFGLKDDKKALPYFYNSTKYKMEFKYDAFVYQAIAKYYFDRQASMASGLSINEFINRAHNLINSVRNERNSFTETAEEKEITTLYRQIVNLYNLRYNLEEDENIMDLASYIQVLLERPLIEPSKNKGSL